MDFQEDNVVLNDVLESQLSNEPNEPLKESLKEPLKEQKDQSTNKEPPKAKGLSKKEVEKVLGEITNKKKPGRPKKNTYANPIEISGIVNVPINTDHDIEFVYSNSGCLKKIISLFRSYNSSDVYIGFSPNTNEWFAIDHMKKVHIYVDIMPANITRYYCKEQYVFAINRANLELVFNILNKTTTEVIIILERNSHSQLLFLIKNNEYDTTEKFEVPVSIVNSSMLIKRCDTSTYPISFKLSSRHLKDRLSNVSKFDTETISFQKCGKEQPFQIICSDNNVSWAGVFNDLKKIEFASKLADNEFFAVSLNTANLYSLTNNNLGNDFVITADKHKKISFVTVLDERDTSNPTVMVSIFIEIISYI